MAALGDKCHIFARPARRQEWRRLLEILAGSGAVTLVPHPAMVEPMLVARFQDGGSVSIEFVGDAEDSDQARRSTWLELRTPDPAALMERVLDAGFGEVRHPGHRYYFAGPGGQVFTVVPSVNSTEEQAS